MINAMSVERHKSGGGGDPDLGPEQASLPLVLLLLVSIATVYQHLLRDCQGVRFLFQDLQLLDTCAEILSSGFKSTYRDLRDCFFLSTFSIFNKAEILTCSSSIVVCRYRYVLLSSLAVLPIADMVRRIRSGDCTTRARMRATPSDASAASEHTLS